MRNRFDNQLAELNKELISMGALCENATDIDEETILCRKKGPMACTDTCRRFKYDPLRRKRMPVPAIRRMHPHPRHPRERQRAELCLFPGKGKPQVTAETSPAVWCKAV